MSDKQRIDRELEALGKLAPAGYFAGLHIRFASPLHVFQTYDKAWTDHYTAQAYAMRDPMIAWGFSTSSRPARNARRLFSTATPFNSTARSMALWDTGNSPC